MSTTAPPPARCPAAGCALTKRRFSATWMQRYWRWQQPASCLRTAMQQPPRAPSREWGSGGGGRTGSPPRRRRLTLRFQTFPLPALAAPAGGSCLPGSQPPLRLCLPRPCCSRSHTHGWTRRVGGAPCGAAAWPTHRLGSLRCMHTPSSRVASRLSTDPCWCDRPLLPHSCLPRSVCCHL